MMMPLPWDQKERGQGDNLPLLSCLDTPFGHTVEDSPAGCQKMLPCNRVEREAHDKEAGGNLTCFCLSGFISKVN